MLLFFFFHILFNYNPEPAPGGQVSPLRPPPIGGQRGGTGTPPPFFTKIGLKRQPRGSIFQIILEHNNI